MNTKVWYLSKTIWFSIITLALSVLAVLQGDQLIQQYPQVVAYIGIAIGLLSGLLRIFTDEGIKVGGGKKFRSLMVFMLASLCIAGAAHADGWGDTTPRPDIKVDGDLCKQVKDSPGLSRAEAHKLGITFRSIRLKAKEMKAAGKLEGLDRNEIAGAVLAELQAENPKLFENVDWDKVFNFISMILKLLALFGAL